MQETNGGIVGYTDTEPEYIVDEEHPYYLVFGDHTRAMNIANQSFSVMDNVKVLAINNYSLLSEDILLFITASWKKSIPNMGYSRHWGASKDTGIRLPVDETGSPDWEYMRLYIHELVNDTEVADQAY